jgi:hypothetical protein
VGGREKKTCGCTAPTYIVDIAQQRVRVQFNVGAAFNFSQLAKTFGIAGFNQHVIDL